MESLSTTALISLARVGNCFKYLFYFFFVFILLKFSLYFRTAEKVLHFTQKETSINFRNFIHIDDIDPKIKFLP